MLIGFHAYRHISNTNDIFEEYSFFPFIAASFLLGQGILASLWVFLGLMSWFKGNIIWCLIAICPVAELLHPSSILRCFIGRLQKINNSILSLSWYWRVLVLLVVSFIMIDAVGAFILPPDGDAEAFYMVFPKILAHSERLIPQRNYFSFSQNGLFGEMHFAALMSIAGNEAAKVFSWVTSLSLALILLGICRKTGLSNQGSIVSLLMLFSSTAFSYNIYNGKVDNFAGALGLAAIFWALHTGSGNNVAQLSMTGLFAGFALIAKFSYIPVLIPGIIVIVCMQQLSNQDTLKRKFSGRSFGYSLSVIGVACLVAMVPHLVKNTALFGEPLAPFIFFRNVGNYWADQTWFSPEATRYILATYPFALCFGIFPMQGGNLSPLILALFPMGYFIKRPDSFVRSTLFQVTITALVSLIIWMVVRPSLIAPRYILALLLLFIPFSAKAAESILSTDFRSRFLAWIVSGSLLISACIAYQIRLHPIMVMVQSIHGTDIFRKISRFRDGLEFLNQSAAMGDRVYIQGYYSYFLRADLLQLINGEGENIGKCESWKEKWEFLYYRGFKYYYIQKEQHTGNEYLRSGSGPEWLNIKKLYEDSSSILFQITSTNPEKKPLFCGRQVHPPAWDVVENQ